MARFFNVGMPKQESKDLRGDIGGCIEKGQDSERPNELKRPAVFGGGHDPLKPGAVTLSLYGVGYWQIGQGEYIDLPDYIPAQTVKNAAPQLLTKEEAKHLGAVNEEGLFIKKPAKATAKQPSDPQ